MYIPHFIYSFADGFLGCFHLLAVVNTAMHISVQVSVWVLACNSFGCILRNGIPGSYGNSMF